MIGMEEGSSSIEIISFIMELFIEKEKLQNMSSSNNYTDFSKLAQEYLTKIKEKEIRKVRVNLLAYAYLNP
jgi:vacuolar-type H+-ATPase subunit E/Vma4